MFLLYAFGVCAFSFSLLVKFVLSLVIDLRLSVPGDEHRPFIDAFIDLFIDFFNGSCGHPRFDRPFIHRFIDPFVDSFISASFFSNAFEKKRSSIIGPPQDHPRPTQDHPKTTPRPPQDRPRPPETAPRPPQDHPRPTQDHPKTTPRPPIGKVLFFIKNVDVALALAMGTFIENPSTRVTVL